jgi:predicted metalloprotease with PDZ domain
MRNIPYGRQLPKVLISTAMLILILAAAVLAKDISPDPRAKLIYHLSWDGRSSVLKVMLEYTPSSLDSTEFIYGEPNIGGQTEIFKVLENIQCLGSDKVRINAKERKLTIYHSGEGTKKISYEVNGKLVGNPKRATVDELFRPLISSKLLYLLPHFFTLNPVHPRAENLTLQWEQYPADVPYFISTAAEATAGIKQVIPLAKTGDVLILMGSDLLIKKYKVHNIPYYAITSISDTLNKMDQELQPFFQSYFPLMRDFWKDDQSSYYYLSILPLLSIDKPWATGFGWGQGFIMKYSGKFNDDKKKVLAHETSHNWIGIGMQIGADEFDNQWFGEGFNDYIMLINLVKADIINQAAFLEHINKENFAAHYGGPVKNVPNKDIAAKFWTDRNYQTLPYKRGFIYAFYLDNQIRLRSVGKRSIRDFLLALADRNREIKDSNTKASLTIQDFTHTAARFIPAKQARKQVEEFMIKGSPIDFHKVKLVEGLSIDYQDRIPVLKIHQNVDLKKAITW